MEGKAIIGLMIVLIFIAYLIPVALDAYSTSRDTASDERAEYTNYSSLSDADKANYTSDYAADGAAPTPWSASTATLFSVIGLFAVIAIINGVRDD